VNFRDPLRSREVKQRRLNARVMASRPSSLSMGESRSCEPQHMERQRTNDTYACGVRGMRDFEEIYKLNDIQMLPKRSREKSFYKKKGTNQRIITVSDLRLRKLDTIGSSVESGNGILERSKLSRLGNTFKKSFPLFLAASARALATSLGSWSVTLLLLD